MPEILDAEEEVVNARRALLRPLEASDSVEQERSCQFALTFRGSNRGENGERAEDPGAGQQGVYGMPLDGRALTSGNWTEWYSHCEVAQIQELVRKREMLKRSQSKRKWWWGVGRRVGLKEGER